MKKLFLIDGAAGTGKTDLIEYVKTKYHNANVLCKYTTRNLRSDEDEENLDLIFLTEEEFSKKNLDEKNVYKYGGKSYGFSEKELNESLKRYEFTLIVIRNRQIIDRLIDEYKYKAFVFPIYIYADRNLIEERLKFDGYTQDKIDFRLKR